MADTKGQKTLAIPPRIVIREFAARLGLPVTQVMGALIKNGIMSSQNEEIDADTATIIAEDFGFVVEQVAAADKDDGPTFIIDDWIKQEDQKSLKPRPPVVVVLGHVDHGKTMLLDTIRKTKVMESEAGGITQGIGAYQAIHKKKPVTFIDTPGHAAFSAMRSRGARVADVAILVVAADDGVMPQTEEAIEILNASALPFVVAINKIDKSDANPDKVKKELAAKNVAPEEYGGNTVMVPISAKAATNIDELLDAVLLVAEVEKGRMVANPKGKLLGTIVESHVDAGEGPVATVLIHNGTLNVGDEVSAGDAYAKIRGLRDSHGKAVTEAGPSFPARLLGFKTPPQVGDPLVVADDPRALKKKAKKQTRQQTISHAPLMDAPKDEATAGAAVTVNLVLKADRLGSLEALNAGLKKFKSEDVRITIIEQGLGNITEADVLRADTGNAMLLGFNVAVSPAAESVAKSRDLKPAKTFTVIYDLLDYIKDTAEAELKPIVEETIIGHLKILGVFRTNRGSMIVGGRVEDGQIELNGTVRVKRNGDVVGDGVIKELQQNKTASKSVVAGAEAGIKFQGQTVIEVGDVLEAVRVTTIRRIITTE